MTAPLSRCHARMRDESGATMVEFAVVLPLLVLMMVAIMEFGLAFHNRLTTNQAARDGVRLVALAGTASDADCKVIEGLGPFLAPVIDRVDRVQIFKARADGSPNPAKTNTYWFTNGDPGDCTRWGRQVKWAPSSRQVVASVSTPLDIAGVRIVYDGAWVTGFPPFEGDYTIDEIALARMEPEAYE